MKKNVFWAVTLLAFIAVGAFAQQYNSESDFKVTKSGNAITITGFVGKITSIDTTTIRIPPSIQNTPVTVIGRNAFIYTPQIYTVIIPNSVTTIEDWAFTQCPDITSVTIGNGVTSIGANAFIDCPTINSVTFIGTIPSGGFKDKGFIGDLRAKFYATDKDKGTPGTYTKNGNTWTLKPAVVTGLNESDFQVTKTGNAITITKYTGSATVVTIPATIQNTPVTIIGDAAFYGNAKITSVIIPNGVTTIGDRAFGAFTSLTSVTIPNSVTSIGISAFEGCARLTSVTIPASVKSIGQGAFASCDALVSVTFLGTIPSSGFASGSVTNPFYPTDLRSKFYATDRNNGTPGTYTKSGTTWTKK
jgi:preprotein translocase subunit YajC